MLINWQPVSCVGLAPTPSVSLLSSVYLSFHSFLYHLYCLFALVTSTLLEMQKPCSTLLLCRVLCLVLLSKSLNPQKNCSRGATQRPTDDTVVVMGSFHVWMWSGRSWKEDRPSESLPWTNKGLKKKHFFCSGFLSLRIFLGVSLIDLCTVYRHRHRMYILVGLGDQFIN